MARRICRSVSSPSNRLYTRTLAASCSYGSGSPVFQCRAKRPRTVGSAAKCSMSVDGSSARSVAQRVPATFWNEVRARMECTAWPISWKSVSRLRQLRSEGFEGAGRAKSQTRTTVGSCFRTPPSRTASMPSFADASGDSKLGRPMSVDASAISSSRISREHRTV